MQLLPLASVLCFLYLLLILLLKTKVKGRTIPDLLVVIGGSTPSIVIALALIITFSGNFGLNLYSTMWIMVVAYLVKYMTMSVRTILCFFKPGSHFFGRSGFEFRC